MIHKLFHFDSRYLASDVDDETEAEVDGSMRKEIMSRGQKNSTLDNSDFFSPKDRESNCFAVQPTAETAKKITN